MAKALWHQDAHTTFVRHEDLPLAGIPGLELNSLYSLISLGTELTVASGKVPQSMHAQMRVPYMEGAFSFPLKYGYSLVGKNGNTLYHLMHPHQSLCVVNPKDCFEIPEGIPPKRATLASNLETALTGIWDGDVKHGEHVAIVGFGMIGSLIARLAIDIPGTEVQIIEPNEQRRSYATLMGFDVLEDLHDAIKPFDVAFHTSATQEGLQTAIDLVGMEGRIVEMSWYGDRSVTLRLGGDFHTMRKRIISSQVSTIPLKMQSEWDYRRRKEAVFELLQNPLFDQHITHKVSLEEAAALFNSWRTQPPEGLGYCIRY